MASCESFLPIQDDSRFVTFRTDEANVENICGGAINEKTLVEWDVPVRNN